ncbi:hypothetical protein [Chloracidobacterium aggregatum]|uniref:Uncharacterized protein n=1 Tax=Chloracidobacterium sp. N TaxID=2821540 RepID=A0ABX8AZZ2_9BACT|nr:hypothetical protein [Chloracidobacterium aggregatum]QUV85437.1 hypothetical protein J8C03_03950 [Chloracidobacterium sp. 2]QUV88161.1 hypothetical protein J8C07_02180 [Chloracidobacterium sp. S]QUV91083.1 hypothetical protein J8C04_01350 [Chloracidobacterium sp. A]QUV94268.1 hypothetical protein J8C05_02120 [Chloracidobacterium sp. N]QUV97469.1 hypothetical protein J8C00_03185 [Chloracidobacterium sp. E]
MNPKYTTAGLAFGLLVALALDTALAQNPKPQVRQKASTRGASPAPQTTDNNPADLPIGVLQGMEDARRYQELVRRAAREGQPAPPLPYATPKPRPAAVAPAGAAYAPPPSASTAPGQPEVSSGTNTATQYQPVMIPVMVPVPANTPQATPSPSTQSLSTEPFHLGQPLTVRPDLVFGQKPQPGTPPPSAEDLRRLREYIEAQYDLRGVSGSGSDFDFDMPSPSSPSPANSAPSSQPISMPGPGPASLPFGRKP